MTPAARRPGILHFGDNLTVLEGMPAESVDLIYLDPPFNSNATYNLIYRTKAGTKSQAQITAFKDTWHWLPEAEAAYQRTIHSGCTRAAELLRAMRQAIGDNDMLAYLAMMTVRLIELHRVLKRAGSLYLHCDPTASHYLKILLDGIFGNGNYRNEIIWQRSNAHNTAKQFGRVHDIILFFTKGSAPTWNTIYQAYSDAQLKRYRRNGEGRLYTCQDLTASRPDSDSGKFAWRGTFPSSGRGWGYTRQQLEIWWAEGRIACKRDGTPRMDGLIVYLEDTRGKPVQDVWVDIARISNTSKERLGWPTQKPLALLERIIQASSNPGDFVLDPFCGCGTAIHAAETLDRSWVGIDITSRAISIIEGRLRANFPGIAFEVQGTPKDLDGARELASRDRYAFQWWAVSRVQGQPYGGKRKGADGGIDGLLYFQADARTTERAIISVKSGKVQVRDIRELKAVLGREKAPIGVFLTLEPPTEPMEREAAAAGFYSQEGRHYQRLQILTAEQILSGKQPAIPLAGALARHDLTTPIGNGAGG